MLRQPAAQGLAGPVKVFIRAFVLDCGTEKAGLDRHARFVLSHWYLPDGIIYGRINPDTVEMSRVCEKFVLKAQKCLREV